MNGDSKSELSVHPHDFTWRVIFKSKDFHRYAQVAKDYAERLFADDSSEMKCPDTSNFPVELHKLDLLDSMCPNELKQKVKDFLENFTTDSLSPSLHTKTQEEVTPEMNTAISISIQAYGSE